MVLPSAGPPPPALPSSTTWPGPSGQCPAFSTTSSTGPPGEARPASTICPNCCPWNWVWTTDSENGPAAAVTPARWPVAASSAALARAAFTVTVACAPF